jgi:hypothetical protein
MLCKNGIDAYSYKACTENTGDTESEGGFDSDSIRMATV